MSQSPGVRCHRLKAPFTGRFKLHIRPRVSGPNDTANLSLIPPLPPGKSVVSVAADFFRYLFECTKQYIEESHANGMDVWNSVARDIDYVISHPNGWGGYQQTQLRDAMELAGLVDGNDPVEKVSFITEGEASLHFALRHGLPKEVMEVSSIHLLKACLAHP